MSNPKEEYAKKLKHPNWQKKRLQILNRDRFTCKLCGDTETTLHIHHKYYVNGNDPWDYPNTALVTLCEHCHTEVESDKINIENFSQVRIFKSNNWQNGSRIMFLANIRTGITRVRIYAKNGTFVAGYNMDMDTQDGIIKVMKFALKPI